MQTLPLNLMTEIYDNVFAEGRLMLYAKGLGNTLIIAAGATLLGIIIGMVVSVIKVYAIDNKALKPLEIVADIYITIIRGTPVMVQLLIMYFVIFASAPNEMGIPIAILSFGINSGAYVAEIIRAGIMSIDKGQMEAGRSLGLDKNTTMRYIILPQAVKNILPALFNEFIVLIKETSVAGMIAIKELTMAATFIRSRTFNAFVPLFFVAIIYLVVVMLLSALQKRIEGRLRASDKR